jgi:nitrate reductase assembly molybdenum cofactor insertion protein NarJ
MKTLEEKKIESQDLNHLYESLGELLGNLLKDRASVERLREGMAILGPEAETSMRQFEGAIQDMSAGEVEEAYTRAFDVAPQCVPYVSVHLFGEENYKRGELMALLLQAFEREGFDHGFELSDHVAVLLRFVPRLSGEERRELLELCLKEPLVRMTAALKKGGNPYGHLLQAARDLVGTELLQNEFEPQRAQSSQSEAGKNL